MHGLFDSLTLFLIFKLQQEVLKLNDVWVSYSSPKTDLENRSFENVNFSQ